MVSVPPAWLGADRLLTSAGLTMDDAGTSVATDVGVRVVDIVFVGGSARFGTGVGVGESEKYLSVAAEVILGADVFGTPDVANEFAQAQLANITISRHAHFCRPIISKREFMSPHFVCAPATGRRHWRSTAPCGLPSN